MPKSKHRKNRKPGKSDTFTVTFAGEKFRFHRKLNADRIDQIHPGRLDETYGDNYPKKVESLVLAGVVDSDRERLADTFAASLFGDRREADRLIRTITERYAFQVALKGGFPYE